MLQQEIARRALPPLWEGGMPSVAAWEQVQRPYWTELLLREAYGQRPQLPPPAVSVRRNKVDFGGKAVWETVRFTFENAGKSHTVPTQMIFPDDGKRHPFIVFLNFRPDVPDLYYPTEELIDGGFGVLSVCYEDITADSDDFESGLAGLTLQGERPADGAGKLMYWAYMASCMLDHLLTRAEAVPEAIGVAGHSRLGKTAMLAAALDERFAFACVNDSGCSGAALCRGKREGAERLVDICGRFPYWFAPNYLKYVDAPEALPFDQHCLAALIAPRRLLVGTAEKDAWADTDAQFLTCHAASPAWEIYGKKGFVSSNSLPVLGDIFNGGEICFHLRAGKHFFSRTDWQLYLASLNDLI